MSSFIQVLNECWAFCKALSLFKNSGLHYYVLGQTEHDDGHNNKLAISFSLFFLNKNRSIAFYLSSFLLLVSLLF